MGRRLLLLPLLLSVALALSCSALAAGADRTSDRGGCDAGTTKNGVTTIPIEVTKRGEEVEPTVNVCFDGKGPYPMALDTGAAISVMSAKLAEELGLEKVGRPFRVFGAGCTTESQAFRLPSWSVGGLELEGGDIVTLKVPGEGDGILEGSFGAATLSRFGAARIDFKRETLTLVGKEGPRFQRKKGATTRLGPLVLGKPKLTVPMTVNASRGVSQTVDVKVGSTKPEPWLIDTGTASSLLDAKIVKRAGLEPTGTAHESATYCSRVTVPEYHAPSLGLSTGKLKPQTIGSFKGLASLDADGILGSYSLWQYGSVVLDWAGGKLILGAG
jgi:Aspartyl protease